jgi:hypothetical protein
MLASCLDVKGHNRLSNTRVRKDGVAAGDRMKGDRVVSRLPVREVEKPAPNSHRIEFFRCCLRCKF